MGIRLEIDNNEKREPLSRWIQWFALAVLVHLALFPLLAYVLPISNDQEKPKRVKMVSLPKNFRHKNVTLPKTKRKRLKKKEDKVDVKNLKGQIVNLPRAPTDEAPDEARFLSKYNSKVARETRSRFADDKYKHATNERTAPTPTSNPLGAPNGRQKIMKHKSGDRASAKNHQSQTKKYQQKQTKKLSLKSDSLKGMFRNQRQQRPFLGDNLKLSVNMGAPNSNHTVESKSPGVQTGSTQLKLFPDKATLGKIAGSPANDVIEDVEEGDGTFLNSRAFKYATFFNRLHQSVSQHWYPRNILQLRDPSGHIYGTKNRVTIINVILNEKGSLINLRVLKTSGVPALDEEALNAFRRAEPFPNPPNALLDGGGRVEFKFGFYVTYDRMGINRW